MSDMSLLLRVVCWWCRFLVVCFFLNKLERWFCYLNCFTQDKLVPFMACCSMSVGSMLKAVLRPFIVICFIYIHCDLGGELWHWLSHYIFLFMYMIAALLTNSKKIIHQFKWFHKQLKEFTNYIFVPSNLFQ